MIALLVATLFVLWLPAELPACCLWLSHASVVACMREARVVDLEACEMRVEW